MKIEKRGFEKGDLLPVYKYMNSPYANPQDETQWEWLFEDRTRTGLNRVGFVAWDNRNAQIAKNILKISQSRKKEKILVIIGFSHKSIVEHFLKASNSVSVESLFKNN